MNYNDLAEVIYSNLDAAPYVSWNSQDQKWEITMPIDFSARPKIEWVESFKSEPYMNGPPIVCISIENQDDVEDAKIWLIQNGIIGEPRESYAKAKALLEMLRLGVSIENARREMEICGKRDQSNNVGYDDLLSGMPDPDRVFSRLRSVAEMWSQKK